MENYIEVFKGEENDIFNEDTIQDFVGICLEKNYWWDDRWRLRPC